MTFTTYVINLDDSYERLAHIKAQLAEEDMDFTRISAFDGRQLRVEEFPNYDGAAAMAYMGRPLRGGEIGCYLSHLKVLQAFLDSDDSHALILEDDADIVTGLGRAVEELITWTAQHNLDWDVVNLGAGKHTLTRQLHDFGAWQLEQAFYFPMRTTGMLWSRAGAADFLAGYSRITCPVDNQIRRWQAVAARGLATRPMLVPPSGADSEIDAGAAPRKAKGRSPFYGLLKQKRLWADKFSALRHMMKSSPLAPRR